MLNLVGHHLEINSEYLVHRLDPIIRINFLRELIALQSISSEKDSHDTQMSLRDLVDECWKFSTFSFLKGPCISAALQQNLDRLCFHRLQLTTQDLWKVKVSRCCMVPQWCQKCGISFLEFYQPFGGHAERLLLGDFEMNPTPARSKLP